MNWWKASTAVAIAQAVRMLSGLVIIKIIAVYLGPEGLGRLGHFMSIIAILSVLAGGGILSGITKYVSEYKASPEKLDLFISNAFAYTIISSSLICVIVFLAAEKISNLLFGNSEFKQLIIFLGCIQFLYGLSTFCIAIVNGLKETDRFAKIIIIGYLLGLPISYWMINEYGFDGAVIGLAVINALVLLPAAYELYRLGFHKKIIFSINVEDTRKLSKFSAMQIISLATLPLVEIYVRSLIINTAGLHEAGLWQSLMRLSSVYVGFFTTFLAAYYMPTLASIFDDQDVYRHVCKYILILGSVFLSIATLIFFFRELIFSVIFSKEFNIPSAYVKYQLLGDFFKIMSYAIGFLLLAKAKTKSFIIFELIQSALYLCISTQFMSYWGYHMVFPAYAISNFIYFSICLIWFYIYGRSISS